MKNEVKTCLLMMLFFVIMSVGFVNAQNETDFKAEITQDGTGVVILEYNGNATNVVVPTTIQGIPVKEISRRAFPTWWPSIGGGLPITSIVIPEGVTKIQARTFLGDRWFGYYNALKSITLPSKLTIIEDMAFWGCDVLESINLPEGLTSIGEGAFNGCSSLRSVTIPNSIVNIGGGAFANSGLISIDWPANITEIGYFRQRTVGGLIYEGRGMFQGSKNLRTVIIPEGVITITQSAFSGCTALNNITLPSTIRTIGSSAFNGCTSLVNITIPSSIRSIEDRVFSGCTSLATVTLPSTIQSIGDRAFSGCTSLTTINIPETVTSIRFGSNTFSGCSSLSLATQATLRRMGYTGSF